MQNLSHVCDLHRPHQILNPLSEARDRTHIFTDISRICFHCATTGTPYDFRLKFCSRSSRRVSVVRFHSQGGELSHQWTRTGEQPPAVPEERFSDSKYSVCLFVCFKVLKAFIRRARLHFGLCEGSWPLPAALLSESWTEPVTQRSERKQEASRRPHPPSPPSLRAPRGSRVWEGAFASTQHCPQGHAKPQVTPGGFWALMMLGKWRRVWARMHIFSALGVLTRCRQRHQSAEWPPVLGPGEKPL